MSQTNEAELVRCARAVARLQTQRRKLRKQLKTIDKDLRVERKHLKALADLMTRDPDIMPSRTFGDSHGFKMPRREKA